MENRARMDRAERAKQFMPFAALKGHMEALHEREREIVSRKELSDQAKEELDREFQKIRRNSVVRVKYFCEGEYLETTGTVSELNTISGFLKISDIRIFFENIYEMWME